MRTLRVLVVAALAAAALVWSPGPTEAATVAPGVYENSSSKLKLSGPWKATKTITASGGTFSSLAKPGYAQVTFNATGVSWVARRGPFFGIATVYLDGRKVKTVDLYAKKAAFKQSVYAVKGLPAGTHVLKVVRTGTKNKASGGANLVLDAFRVLDITPPTRPTGVATTAERTGAKLTWSQTKGADLAGFRVHRRTGAGVSSLVATVPAAARSFRDHGLADATTYFYDIVAYDTSGNRSKQSAAVAYSTPGAKLYTRTRYAACPAATTTVKNWPQLQAALAGVKPGTVIRLQPGTYAVPWSAAVTARGTAAAPVWICGPRTAVITGSGVRANGGFRIDKSTHLTLAGMTIRNSQKGVSVLHSSFVTVADTLIERIGEEAVHLKSGTTDSVVVGNTIRDTGLATPAYGEGVYVGTAKPNWCAYNGCQPDRSDRNAVVHNTISRTTAESVEAKAGARNGFIAHNTIDGTGMKAAETLVSVQTDGWVVAYNAGADAPVDGVQVWNVHDAYGRDNILYANRFSGSVPGFAVRLAYAELGNVVGCDTVAAPDSKAVSNKPCQR